MFASLLFLWCRELHAIQVIEDGREVEAGTEFLLVTLFSLSPLSEQLTGLRQAGQEGEAAAATIGQELHEQEGEGDEETEGHESGDVGVTGVDVGDQEDLSLHEVDTDVEAGDGTLVDAVVDLYRLVGVVDVVLVHQMLQSHEQESHRSNEGTGHAVGADHAKDEQELGIPGPEVEVKRDLLLHVLVFSTAVRVHESVPEVREQLGEVQQLKSRPNEGRLDDVVDEEGTAVHREGTLPGIGGRFGSRLQDLAKGRQSQGRQDQDHEEGEDEHVPQRVMIQVRETLTGQVRGDEHDEGRHDGCHDDQEEGSEVGREERTGF